MSVRCGNKAHDFDISSVHYHGSVAEVRECYASDYGIRSIQEGQQDAWEIANDPDIAYERHLENACSEEHRAFEAWEYSMGLIY